MFFIGWTDQLDRVEQLLKKLLAQGEEEMSALTDLQAQVEQTTTIEASAITLIQGIAQQLKDAIAAGDPAALTDLQSKLSTSATALAAAITANTTPTP